ncbi:MAG: PqqD family protein [Beijerinckiaceae bacterium]|nr:MAG: PqqD family protein [Beijerinckiaceae bacterium]
MMESGGLQSTAVFLKADGYDVIEVEDGFVINDDTREQVHFMNATGAIVYELCDGRASVADIVQFIDQTFSLKASSSNDVMACLGALADKGLVVKRLS